MKQLRTDLAAGHLNDHCRSCTTCPIVQRRIHAEAEKNSYAASDLALDPSR